MNPIENNTLRGSALSLLFFLGGGSDLNLAQTRRTAFIKTDSAAFTVTFEQLTYRASIGFTYVNRSGSPVSAARCGKPGPPDLEKLIGSRWTRVYSPISVLCRSNTDFVLGNNATYHATLDFVAFEPGHNMQPSLRVDSIDGTYRLRWSLVSGSNPDKKNALRVETLSNNFQLTLAKQVGAQSPAPPLNTR